MADLGSVCGQLGLEFDLGPIWDPAVPEALVGAYLHFSNPRPSLEVLVHFFVAFAMHGGRPPGLATRPYSVPSSATALSLPPRRIFGSTCTCTALHALRLSP